MENPLLGFEGAKQKQRLHTAGCSACAARALVLSSQSFHLSLACSQDSSVLSPLLHRLDRSPQHLRNPDESRACSCFLSSSAAATSCRWFVAVDLASPLLCTAAAGFLVRCGISGAPSIRTDSDRPLRSWVFGF